MVDVTIALLGTTPDKATRAWQAKLSGEEALKLKIEKSAKSVSKNVGVLKEQKSIEAKNIVPSPLPNKFLNQGNETSSTSKAPMKPFSFASGPVTTVDSSKSEAITREVSTTLPKAPLIPSSKDSSKKADSPFSFASIPAKDTPTESKDKKVEEVAQSTKFSPLKPKQDAESKPIPASPDYHAIILKFYQDHNPSKVGDVDKLLIKYKVSSKCHFHSCILEL